MIIDQISSYSINTSNNYESIIDSIETMDGYAHFTTNETMLIKLSHFSLILSNPQQKNDDTQSDFFIKINFKLSFVVWTEIERFDNGNEIVNILVDFHNVHNIILNTNYPFQKKTNLLEFIDSIPANDNDVINMVFDECVDQWDEPFNNLSIIFL